MNGMIFGKRNLRKKLQSIAWNESHGNRKWRNRRVKRLRDWIEPLGMYGFMNDKEKSFHFVYLNWTRSGKNLFNSRVPLERMIRNWMKINKFL